MEPQSTGLFILLMAVFCALLFTLVAMAVSGAFYLSGMRTLGQDTARVQEISAGEFAT
jgi:hypothetical protein